MRWGKWVKALGSVISGISWVDKRQLWLVDGIQGNHWPIISNACPPKRSRKSLAVALKACTHYTIMENFKFAQTEMKSGYFAFLLQGT